MMRLFLKHLHIHNSIALHLTSLTIFTILLANTLIPTVSWAYKNEFYDREPATNESADAAAGNNHSEATLQYQPAEPRLQHAPRPAYSGRPEQLTRPPVSPREGHHAQ